MAGLQSETGELLALAQRLEGAGPHPPAAPPAAADEDGGDPNGVGDGLPAVRPPPKPAACCLGHCRKSYPACRKSYLAWCSGVEISVLWTSHLCDVCISVIHSQPTVRLFPALAGFTATRTSLAGQVGLMSSV